MRDKRRGTHGRPSVLAAGYVALDVIRAPSGTWLRAGGTAANVAANLAFMGWDASIVGVLGKDDAGRIVRTDLARAGVDTRYMELRDGVSTPLVLHDIHPSGDHTFRFGCPYCGRPYARHHALPEEILDRARGFTHADVFFFDRASAGALRLAADHQRAKRLVLYEPSSGGRPKKALHAAQLAHVVKYSAQRGNGLEAVLPPPSDSQVRIVTLAAQGSKFRIGRSRWHRLSPIATNVVDSAGAGIG